jgi:hypothetical protein
LDGDLKIVLAAIPINTFSLKYQEKMARRAEDFEAEDAHAAVGGA